jgi:Tfp pilus assembly protein PilF
VYRRAIAELALNAAPAAVTDLERVIGRDPKYDLHRAIGLLAHAYARSGQPDRADATFIRHRQADALIAIAAFRSA